MKILRNLVILSLCVCFCLAGCETETKVKSGHICDMTQTMSTEYAVKVCLDEDERVNEKFVEIQLKSNKEEQILNFGEENVDKMTICLPKKDYWYNLTYLKSKSNGSLGEGSYQKYEDFGNKMYIFTSNNDVDLTFRIVVGETKFNEETNEEILLLSEPVSDEVTINVKKNQEK